MKKPRELIFELVALGPITECRAYMEWYDGGRVDNSGYHPRVHLKGKDGEGKYDTEVIDKYFDYRLGRGIIMSILPAYRSQVASWNEYAITHAEELAEIARLEGEIDKADARHAEEILKINEVLLKKKGKTS